MVGWEWLDTPGALSGRLQGQPERELSLRVKGIPIVVIGHVGHLSLVAGLRTDRLPPDGGKLRLIRVQTVGRQSL